MSSLPYKNCAVPLCISTTTRTPRKLFIHVPKSINVRETWLHLARRDPKNTSVKSTMYFCEDHFNLPDDMENYMEYCIMGSVKSIRLKPNRFPSKFSCQGDKIKRTAPIPQPVTVKRLCTSIVEQAERTLEETVMATTSNIGHLKSTGSHSMIQRSHEGHFQNKTYPDINNCSFLDTKQPELSLLADRGIKCFEQPVQHGGSKLVRPPSVYAKIKLSKQEAHETKQVPSLRIDTDKVIRCSRELSMLKPHSELTVY